MNSATRKSFTEIIALQLNKYPLAQSQDMYKLAFQAAMGSAHAASDMDSIQRRLESELSETSPSRGESLVEIICPYGHVARVNLRPYMAKGHDLRWLATAFAETAGSFQGSPSKLITYCHWLIWMQKKNLLPPSMNDIAGVLEIFIQGDMGSTHHSRVYRLNYMPSYRVVATRLIDKLLNEKA